MEILKIFGVAVCGTVLVLVLKEQKPAFGTLLTLALSLFLFFLATPHIAELVQTLRSLFDAIGGKSNYFDALLKIIGISMLGQIGADVCKDAGLTSVASTISLFGRIASLLLCLPAVETLITLIGGVFPA